MQTLLSIIIPAWKEANRIGGSLERLSAYITVLEAAETEVLVVVADSPDRTLEIAQSKSGLFKNYKVIQAGPRAGKGRDVRLAMQEAKGEYKLFMDADMATPLHHLNTVRKLMKEKADLIIGVRNLQSSHIGLRKLISNAGNLLVRWVLGMNIRDTQCGFKAFRGSVGDDLFGVQTINGWGFDMELLAIAKQRGYSIQTIHIHDWKDVDGGTFDNTAIRGALSTLKDLLTIKWNLLTGRYEELSKPVQVLQKS
ncbi:MAG: glycosyltransferase [Bacteroidetes bacterium]|jgi:dolichyl-phosphate beta-glucosyltransferase|nr:glycosyltransferase [Bacteroidota bacterium]